MHLAQAKVPPEVFSIEPDLKAMNARRKKLIGEGLQFRVYQLNKRRVVKIPTSHTRKLITLRRWKMQGQKRQEIFARSTVKTLGRSLKELKNILGQIDTALLGNPTLLKHPSYEQDFAEPLGSYFKKHNLRINKRIVQLYVKSIIEGWRFGLADTIFNFTINNGVADKNVILLDLGELTFSKNKIRTQIKKKYWRKKWSYMSMTDSRLKKYIDSALTKHLTVKALEKNWKIALLKNNHN